MIDHDQLRACLTERRLRLILLPTEACNFRCVYCYEDFRLARMKPRVVRGVKNLLDRRAPELDQLHLSWFGGEPLLARGLIEDVLIHVRGLLRANPRVRFSSDATTNAYHLEEPLFRRLVGLGVTAYHITFDGPREWHDRRRLKADGSGTFDVIWNNLLAISKVEGQFGITVRLHVDAENHVALPRFLDQYREVFGDDSRFTLFIRRVSKLGGPGDDVLPVLDGRKAESVLDNLKNCAEGRNLEAEAEGDQPAICYAAQANSFVVRADGKLNKCTVALSHPRNEIGRLEENGDLTLYQGMSEPWMRGLVSGDPDELECPMHGFADPVRASAKVPEVEELLGDAAYGT